MFRLFTCVHTKWRHIARYTNLVIYRCRILKYHILNITYVILNAFAGCNVHLPNQHVLSASEFAEWVYCKVTRALEYPETIF